MIELVEALWRRIRMEIVWGHVDNNMFFVNCRVSWVFFCSQPSSILQTCDRQWKLVIRL